MAANKFATILHRKTNKLTVILVYTFLEWVFIFFLLLNSLFSYLIFKFADYFGLKTPCLWCSRLDQVFDPSKFHNSHRSLVCESHSVEISQLGYCSNHRKLAESELMCEDCSSFVKAENSKNAENFSKCCCCGVSLEKTLDHVLIKPFSGDSEKTQKGNLILGNEADDQFKEDGETLDFVYEFDDEDRKREEKTGENFSSFGSNEMVANETDKADVEMRVESREIEKQHLDFYIDQDACHLIPIEWKKLLKSNEIEEGEDFVKELDKYEQVLESRSSFEEKVPLLDPILECEEEEGEEEEEEEGEEEEEEGFEIEQSAEAETELHDNQADITVGTEIPAHQTMEDIPSLLSTTIAIDGSKQDEEHQVEVEFQSLTVDTSEPEMNNHLSFVPENNEIVEEEKTPDTPNSVESVHHLNKKFMFLERRESSIEESLDGSVTSDIEAGDGVVTLERLKTALKAERKALNDVYAELEEERSASAIAANQTMAMINRLQEEKAAMQMEALQYQRMMEEQSEYDQEALQLMNELIVKREKERVELEKELELYRKKVEEYETREKMLMLKRMKESTSSTSYGEERDGLSVDSNHETKGENGFENSNQNTPIDAVLANFEEERMSILDQLKVLEEKLFTLSEPEENEERQHICHENGNGYTNHIEVNGKHEKRYNGAKAKRLLALFDDVIEGETEAKTENGHKEEEATDTKGVAIEEEVEQVYERLQALEEDREFLKLCMTSLRKGDKGIELLQEILQHLQDLRYVETRGNGHAYS